MGNLQVARLQPYTFFGSISDVGEGRGSAGRSVTRSTLVQKRNEKSLFFCLVFLSESYETMKVLSIILLRWRNGAAPLVLASEYNLAEFSFFTRGSVKEVALFVSREVVQRANGASLMSVKHKEYLCHAKITSGGLAACVLADEVRHAQKANLQLLLPFFFPSPLLSFFCVACVCMSERPQMAALVRSLLYFVVFFL
jgi:hypothetical protein